MAPEVCPQPIAGSVSCCSSHRCATHCRARLCPPAAPKTSVGIPSSNQMATSIRESAFCGVSPRRSQSFVPRFWLLMSLSVPCCFCQRPDCMTIMAWRAAAVGVFFSTYPTFFDKLTSPHYSDILHHLVRPTVSPRWTRRRRTRFLTEPRLSSCFRSISLSTHWCRLGRRAMDLDFPFFEINLPPLRFCEAFVIGKQRKGLCDSFRSKVVE